MVEEITIPQAAEVLRIEPSTLHEKLKALGKYYSEPTHLPIQFIAQLIPIMVAPNDQDLSRGKLGLLRSLAATQEKSKTPHVLNNPIITAPEHRPRITIVDELGHAPQITIAKDRYIKRGNVWVSAASGRACRQKTQEYLQKLLLEHRKEKIRRMMLGNSNSKNDATTNFPKIRPSTTKQGATKCSNANEQKKDQRKTNGPIRPRIRFRQPRPSTLYASFERASRKYGLPIDELKRIVADYGVDLYSYKYGIDLVSKQGMKEAIKRWKKGLPPPAKRPPSPPAKPSKNEVYGLIDYDDRSYAS